MSTSSVGRSCLRLLQVCSFVVLCTTFGRAQGIPTVSPGEPRSRMIRPLALSQTRYEFQAGGTSRLAGDRETLDFISKARRRWIGIAGEEARGFVVSPALSGDEPLLAASHLATPGEYTVTLSATSDTGEERATTLSVVLNPMQPVPSTATRPPVVLLNGWQFGFSNNGCPISSGPSDTFGNLAQYLEGDGVPVVYFFDNCVECPSCKIEDLGNTLQQFLNLIQYNTGGLVPQIDLVTHSMGGLIARAYLAGVQADGSLLPPPNPRVRKLVLIAEPNFGSFIAVNIGTQTAEMIPGSPLLWELATWNQGGDDLRGVDALGIIGSAGSWNSLMNASDGVVSLTSGSIGFARDPTRTRILPYCHIDPSPLVDLFMDCSAAPGIAKIDSVMHPTWTIIQSFLAGTSDWASIGGTPSTDPYLSQYGGIYFAVESAADQFLADLTQVLFGSTALVNGGAAGTVFYNEFAVGTGKFDATSSSLGPVTYGPTTVPTGRFTAVRAKFAPAISSVGPIVSNYSALLVQSGTTIMINGAGFGQFCSGCQILAAPAGSSVGYPLQILTWTDNTITAMLPATYTGFVRLFLKTASGQDEINIMAGPSLAGSMAQLASGGGWNTTLTLINTGATPGEALLEFFGNNGGALELPLTFPQTLSSAGQVVSTLDRTVGANSLLVLDSQQPANPNSQVGSAQLFSNSNVGGFATFKYTPTGQEAVVPLETRNSPSYVLAYDNTGALATGVAIANVSTQPASIPVVIRDDTGAQIGTNTITLPAQGHTSFMLIGNYPATAGKRGTIEFDTPPSGRISVLGLRANGKALTTIPVLANVAAGGGSMAQVASGGGWQTTFTLANTGTSAAQVRLSFFDNNGNAMPLPLTLLQTGNVKTASTLSQTIAAGATLVVLTPGSSTGASVVGSAQLTTTGNVSGFAIFHYNPTGQEAVVPLETRNASAYVLAFDNTGSLATGLALANGSNQSASVPIVLRDDAGARLGTATINLAANGHTSFMLAGSYPSVAGKRGTVEFDTPAGAQIGVLGLRATPSGVVTTIPVLAK